MDNARLQLNTGKQLQLIIAATHDLPSTLAPHRARRVRRSAKLAAGLGGATSAVVGGALWAANLGFWASLGAALGLGTIPVLATLGATGFAFGLPGKRNGDEALPQETEAQLQLTFSCFQLMARADGHISDEERVLLEWVLHQFPLDDEARQRIEQADASALESATRLDPYARRQVLQGCWTLAETDGVTPEEEELFEELAHKLGLGDEVITLKRQSRDLQAGVNDLVTAMFRCCQQVLAPTLGEARTNEFLESLAYLAATPLVRRSLRNDMASGFSAGGVARLLDEHGEAAKLVAQAHNSTRAVCGDDGDALRQARARLLALTDGTRLDGRTAKGICADIDTLFDDALRANLDDKDRSPGV